MTRLLTCVVGLCVVFGCTPGPARPVSDVWVEPVTGMRFTLIPSGTFTMGSPPGEIGREEQELQHTVELSRPFWIGLFEVTQQEWRAVMGSDPSHFRSNVSRLPVEQVTWFEAQDFLQELTERSPGNSFRLPTEAEWEYACRAGTSTPYGTGQTISTDQANFAESAERAAAGQGQTKVVGSFQPNAWGLHDMHGNVWEWTTDEHCPYQSGVAVDPVSSCGEPLKVIRGGSWYFGADSARCALRYTHRPQDRGFSLGLRIVREPARP